MVAVLSVNVCIFTYRTAFISPVHCKITLSLHRISFLAQSVCQTELCDLGLVMRDTYFWSQASFPLAVNNLQRGQCSWWMHTEASAMLQHSGSTGKVNWESQPAVVRGWSTHCQNTQNNLWSRLCANPSGMEEAVVCSSQWSSDGRPGRVGVLQKWQCQEANTRDWSQLVWAGMMPGGKYNLSMQTTLRELPFGSTNMTLSLLPFKVDAGLSFSKKDLEHSYIFDIKTIDRVFYLVADSEEEMNKWVRCICDICGFNPTDDGKNHQHSAHISCSSCQWKPNVSIWKSHIKLIHSL